MKRRLKNGLRQGVSFNLALLLLLQCAWPTTAMALTGGPSQPEVQSFEPIGTSDMVDLFSGDFSYNIPLFDMDGYPMNISYHSGITRDQEASWTGLGWNVNAGVINRNMRGLPDDFNGDQVIKQQNVKRNQTIGISCGLSTELFGTDNASIGARLGIKYNNYTGVGIERSFNVAISTSNKYGGKGTVSLGITSSSDDGLTLSPAISLTQSTSKTTSRGACLGITVGTSFNSRGGLTALSITPEVTMNMNNSKNDKGLMINHSASHALNGAHFNFMQSTFSPNIDFPMHNTSITASLKFGLEAYGFAGSIAPTAYYQEQGQISKTINAPAYGYMNSHIGQSNSQAMLDFNREKDGAFTPYTYNLPITNFTYDFYSVAGQGTGGSYRPFRSDVGHVFDAASYSTSDGDNVSVEAGGGAIFKAGTDICTNSAYSHSGEWSTAGAAQTLAFEGTGNYQGYEPWYFKEANERSVNSDAAFLTRYGGYGAVRPELVRNMKFDVKSTGNLIDKNEAVINIDNTGYRKSRDKRNQTIITLSNQEVYDGMGLFGVNGMSNAYIKNNISKLGHHIGQITSLNTDGKRYVYSLPVYNKEQQEMNFAVGLPVGPGTGHLPQANGLVQYSPGTDNTVNNTMGLDNYFNNTIMPPFAHSYMLSAVLSPDYVDVTGNGPTDDDLGNYTLFEYTESTAAQDYKWRMPVEQNMAKYNPGLLCDDNDDKGSIVYGVKQLYYLKKITSRNYTADFITSARLDGKGVNDINGGISSGASQMKLDQIVLKAKATGAVIKIVNFQYTYDLCPNTSNSVASTDNPNKGKLTLSKLFFTYATTSKGAFNRYKFNYTSNPSYDDGNSSTPQNFDRWGNYKSTNPSDGLPGGGGSPGKIPFDQYPYSNQNPAYANVDAAAWHLTRIELPSGGDITVEYESDDYAYVQNKQAMQMYTYGPQSTEGTLFTINSANGFDFTFPLPADAPLNTTINDLLPDNGLVFFKFKVCMANYSTPATRKFEYVPGYARYDPNPAKTNIFASVVTIHFDPVPIDDAGAGQTTPFSKAAVQFGRLNASRLMYNQPNASSGIGTQIIEALVNSSFFSNMSQALQGPNQYIAGQNHGTYADLNCSWIKLKNVSGHKYGGGSRVKSVKMTDNFTTMTVDGNPGEASTDYGQMYTYTTVYKGKAMSSGVASYEPQIGGEENALKEPFFTEDKHLLAPDDEHYTEAPFGESFYPSASVGYSEVKVTNYVPALPTGKFLQKHGTGYMVHNFYTARDFPTISERTKMDAYQDKSDPMDVGTLLNSETQDYMTVSQGFYVELNDMHGKPQGVRTYDSYGHEIASTEYYYKCGPSANGINRLKNTVTTIRPTGGVASADVGVFFDAVGDLREEGTESETDDTNINIDGFELIIPIVVIVPISTFISDKTQFRSATLTKVVQRFGILDKTVVKKEGSTVTSSDLAYDSETGEVLLTQTINDFNDPVYSFKYPAYWYNPAMGSAYKNIGYSVSAAFTAGKATLLAGQNLFTAGDEIEVMGAGGPYKYWITKSLQNKIEVMDMTGGNALNGTYTIKVLRSGYKNMQTMDMASISSLVNPINGVASNIYQKVISASAIEYANVWGTNCDCINTIGNRNPYVNGTIGNYRPVRNYSYLTNRTQTSAQNNTNTRIDGVFADYTPFYKCRSGRWVLNPYNWTYTSEVTEYSPFGQELENIDALGRYSAATYGFSQNLATAVGANTRYRELGYDGFEDDAANNCSDKHFKFDNISAANLVTYHTGGHTGNTSLKLGYPTNGTITYPTVQMMKKVSAACYRESDCKLQVTYNATNHDYEITNGVAPYVIDVQKTGGDGSIVIADDGKSFTVSSASAQTYKCKLIIMDSKGCVVNKTLQYPFTN